MHNNTDPAAAAAQERVGVWLVGARGSLATTTVAGCAAIAAGLRDTTGLVTERAPLSAAPLPALDRLVFGGHDVAETTIRKQAEALADDGVIPATVLLGVGEALDAADEHVRPGVLPHSGEPPAEAIARVRTDLESFRRRTGVDRIVVINVASTEAVVRPHAAHASMAALDAALGAGRDVLPPSSMYALAAFEAGCSFVDFTPSTGARLPALDEAAREARVTYAGSDGKTGETLVKSALAPMFGHRNLGVRSWAGTNLLGGGDGATLADPDRVQSKLRSKSRTVEQALGYAVDQPLHIDYVADMGGWKTAWDHISFTGFLGVKMTMQFTWQGCDSALAAPLVLDLARLVAAAHAAGRVGPLPELGYFFKDGLGNAPGGGLGNAPGDGQHADLTQQYLALCDFAASLSR